MVRVMAARGLLQPSRAALSRSPFVVVAPAVAAFGDAYGSLGSARTFSSSPTELSPYQKLQKWLQPFVTGSKLLYQENRQAWAIRRRLKDGDAKSAVVSRREMMVLRQAHRDLLKSLPLLAFFCVPLAGYAAPLLGYQFPKLLLPWQFWRPDQRTQFFREDAEARAALYPTLVTELLRVDRDSHTLERMLKTEGTNLGLTPAQVGELAPFFEGPAALPRLGSPHVHVLARTAIMTVPALAPLLAVVPKTFLVARLEKRMDEMRVDDLLLIKEGIDDLSLSELEFACFERGLVAQYGDILALKSALADWLTMYGADQTAAAPLSASLLLHAPAIASFAPPPNSESDVSSEATDSVESKSD